MSKIYVDNSKIVFKRIYNLETSYNELIVVCCLKIFREHL
jgi:hypothetical protein